MKIKLISVLAMTFIFISTASAGRESNGGNAVVCYQSEEKMKIVSVEMYDYWEQKEDLKGDIQLDLGAPDLSIAEKIKLFTDRIALFDLERSRRYQLVAMRLLNDIDSYLTQMGLTPVDDDNGKFKPTPPCYKEQFAIQIGEPRPFQRKFQISERIWHAPETDNDARAGLILHETIYREEIERNAPDSTNTRYFNFVMASDMGALMAEDSYRNMLTAINFPFIPYFKHSIASLGIEVIVNERFSSLNGKDGNSELRLGEEMEILPGILGVTQPLLLPKGSTIHLLKNNQLKSIEGIASGSIQAGENTFKLSEGANLEFNETQQVTSISLFEGNKTYETAVGDIVLSGEHPIYFYDDGSLRRGYLAKKSNIAAYGRTFLADGDIEFTEEGKLLKLSLMEPTLLSIAGGEFRAHFSGETSFDLNGGVTEGTAHEAIKISGYDTNWVSARSSFVNNQVRVSRVKKFGPYVKVDGKKVHYDSSSPHFAQICQRLGYQTWSSSDLITLEVLGERLFGGRQDLYDPATDSFFEADPLRYYEVIGDVTCQRSEWTDIKSVGEYSEI